MINKLAAWLGFVRVSQVKSLLQYGPSVSKRLDEHREVVERIQSSTTMLIEYPWHVRHLAEHDDYLMRLYHMVHGFWPDEPNRRLRYRWVCSEAARRLRHL